MIEELFLLPYQENSIAQHKLATLPEASENWVIHKVDYLSSSLRLRANHEGLTHLGFDFVADKSCSVGVIGSNNPRIRSSIEEGKAARVVFEGIEFASGAVT